MRDRPLVETAAPTTLALVASRASAAPRRARATLLAAIAAGLAGCSQEPSRGVHDDLRADGGSSVDPQGRAMAPFDPDPCAHVAIGAQRNASSAAALGRAHARARWFGPSTRPKEVDAALASALSERAANTAEAAKLYGAAARTAGVCFVTASDARPLGAASARDVSGVTVVTPGTGDLGPLPPGSRAVALDLRSVGDDDASREALTRALLVVAPKGLRDLDVEDRLCTGLPDEVFSLDGPPSVYGCKTAVTRGAELDAHGPDLPLLVLTGEALSPAAARVAALLASRGGARLVGESVPTAVAESDGIPGPSHALTVRTRTLLVDDAPLPDVLEALRTPAPIEALDTALASPAPARDGASERPRLGRLEAPTPFAAPTASLGEARAALVGAYAAARTFFPYFDVVGDTIDERLDETLAIVDGDRAVTQRALRRFGEALHDGHVFLAGPRIDYPRSPVALVARGVEVLVARAGSTDARPGDRVLAIDGRPASLVLAEAEAFVSGSPQTARGSAAGSLAPAGARLLLDGPSGQREVVLRAGLGSPSTFGMYDRPRGWLSDVGAPDVYYVTLNGTAPTPLTVADVADVVESLPRARGLVLDLRGYPNEAAWELLGAIAPSSSTGPLLLARPVRAGASQAPTVRPTQRLGDWTTTRQRYTGPVVLLVDWSTQSNAEHFVSFFRSTQRGPVVGGATSGANGNITGVQLPGALGFSFTGMIVRHADGSTFHARGHVPDVALAASADDLRAGRDAVLLRGIAALPPR